MKLFSFRFKTQETEEVRLGYFDGRRHYHLHLLQDAADPLRELFELYDNDQPKIAKVIAAADRAELITDSIDFLPPVLSTQKVICIGLNYRDHIEEGKRKIPDRPIIFAKYPTALAGHKNPVPLPLTSKQVDYEGELAFYLGKKGKRIPREKAYDYIAGYTVFNDVSARDFQFGDGQYTRGKSCDSFAPCGPYLVTTDEVPDPQALALTTLLNGERMQNSNTSNLIFDVPTLTEFISQEITLFPGDIVATGTPSGVGVFRNPPVFLKHGDVIRIQIENIGELENEFL